MGGVCMAFPSPLESRESQEIIYYDNLVCYQFLKTLFFCPGLSQADATSNHVWSQ